MRLIAVLCLLCVILCEGHSKFESGNSWALSGNTLQRSVGSDLNFLPLSLTGRGSMSIHTCLSTTPKASCSIYYSEYIGGSIVWSQQALLCPSVPITGSSFGSGLGVVGGTAIIGSPGNAVPGGAAGLAYVFRGGWTRWSQQQVLKASDAQTNMGSDFGESVAVTEDLALIGAPSDDDKGTQTGSVYAFSNSDGCNWSQQQKLTARDTISQSLFGATIVSTSDTAAIGAPGVYGNPYPGAVYVFTLDDNKWSQRQKLEIENGNGYQVGTFISMYGKYIVIGSSTEEFDFGSGLVPGVGSVYVFKKYMNGKYSLQQQLWQPNPSTTGADYFGDSVSIYSDTIFVGGNEAAATPGSTYVYVLEDNSWTNQQVINDPTPGAPRFINPHIYGASAIVTDDLPTAHYLSTNLNWSCLVVSVSDQFGDGWDQAKLVVSTPDGSTDSFAPYCDSRNPFRFRYCPTMLADAGTYSFSIPKAKDAAFFWEISWSVLEEKSGVNYMGDHATTMIFDFDDSTASFSFVSAERLVHNSTCKVCPGRPNPKPKPKPEPVVPIFPGSLNALVQKSAPSDSVKPPKMFRRLQQSDSPTSTPTSVPTNWPTLNNSQMNDWHWLSLQDASANGWFESDGSGTTYYISDADGRRLVSTGTLCNDMFSYQCWQPLLDGSYVLRVGGALDSNGVDHSWSFCGKDGGIQTQLLFKVSNGQCEPIMSMSKGQYCAEGASVFSRFKGKILIKGLFNDTEFTQGDMLLLSKTLVSLVSINSVEVSVYDSQFSSSLNGILVSFTLTVSSSSGFDVRNYASLEELDELLSDTFSQSVSNGAFLSALSTTSDFMTGDTGVLKDASSIILVEFQFDDVIFSTKSESSEESSEATDGLDPYLANSNSAIPHSSPIFVYSLSGAAIGLLLVAFVVLLGWRGRTNQTSAASDAAPMTSIDDSSTALMRSMTVSTTSKEVTLAIQLYNFV